MRKLRLDFAGDSDVTPLVRTQRVLRLINNVREAGGNVYFRAAEQCRELLAAARGTAIIDRRFAGTANRSATATALLGAAEASVARFLASLNHPNIGVSRSSHAE
jgi:hypothetical protein